MHRFLLSLVFAIVSSGAAGATDARRPNIIFILADDLGWTDTGVYGSQYYETPNIDRLASQGMKFNAYHNCQNCAPTRSALMSGQYAPRTGIYTVGGIERFNWQSRPLRPVDNVENLPLDRDIIAKQLKSVGYATALFGKWHLGNKDPYHPLKRGFDEAVVSMGRHYDFGTSPATEYPKGIYLADWLTDLSVDFISRQKAQPFFLYLPHFGVHSPHQAKPELIEKFKSKQGVGGHNDPKYAAMIYSIDESVGRILKTLDDLNLTNETVVIFSSDNGGVGGYVREGIKEAGEDITDNQPLRSGKGSLYEGGNRVPFIVRWPGVTKPGSVCNVPTVHVDVYPTFLEIANAPKPSHPLDGESLVTLLHDGQAKLQREAIYQHFPGYLGAGDNWRTTPVGTMISGDWKLMEFFEQGKLELYNLQDDLGETKNLAEAMPEKAQSMHAKMIAWRESIQAPIPTKNDLTDAPSKKNARKGQGKRKAKQD